MKRANILVGVPCFGGNLQHRCVSSLISVLRAMDSAGMRHTLMLVSNESLITRARNYFANVAASAWLRRYAVGSSPT
jgi:hypothetical protein